MQGYVETARRRQQQRQRYLEKQRQQALELAHHLAQRLREEFNVRRVVLFGSVLSETAFHETSDLDLAVWGLPPAAYLKALARLSEQSEIPIDLVEAESASPYIQEAIAHGMSL
ncbi:nucleotidyltransferase domain-containing protein [Thermoleptolyngbya sichuanensis XZ-Cy5]|uniref:nucleotidyltransferase family protein n=1 Tax=Thermoleptolyngbya sichuanensis TaxID=2885951 RepID=UPI00240D0413|nr:nucleotidyltransferase domain-containing protein [Thermoleptolyngbya sichuanensis]MDG2617775.1 nucleotidyltransferase domain-containing protein [Thermoleptolyngbya sichuanensis XZ-Cy5]